MTQQILLAKERRTKWAIAIEHFLFCTIYFIYILRIVTILSLDTGCCIFYSMGVFHLEWHYGWEIWNMCHTILCAKFMIHACLNVHIAFQNDGQPFNRTTKRTWLTVEPERKKERKCAWVVGVGERKRSRVSKRASWFGFSSWIRLRLSLGLTLLVT